MRQALAGKRVADALALFRLRMDPTLPKGRCNAASGRAVECRHILLPSAEALQDVTVQLDAGEDFAGAALALVAQSVGSTCDMLYLWCGAVELHLSCWWQGLL